MYTVGRMVGRALGIVTLLVGAWVLLFFALNGIQAILAWFA